MEGDGVSPPSSSDSGLTSTADLPIAPAYGGISAIYSFASAMRTGKKAFLSEQFYKRPDYGTDYPNPFVPHPRGPRGGIDVQRHMAGVGIPFADPLDNFKPGRIEIDKKQQPVRRPSRPIDSSRMRKKGTSAYRKMNKDNVDAGEKF